MSSIERFYTTTIAVTRMTWDGDSAAEVSGSSFSGHIQQMRPDLVEQLGFTQTKTHEVWCAIGTDVEEGDTLTISSGDYAGTYSVRQIQKNAVGNNQHLELIVEQDIIPSA